MQTASLVSDLRNCTSIGVPIDGTIRDRIVHATNSWKRFCGLPSDVKRYFEYVSVNGMGIGYECKSRADGLDPKEDFQCSLGAAPQLVSVAERAKEETAIDFVQAGLDLLASLRDPAVELAAAIGREYNLPLLADAMQRGRDHWTLRFLHYPPGHRSGEVIAEAHPDKSCFTAHLLESTSGLQRLTAAGEWQELPLYHDEIAVFAGLRLQYCSQGAVKAVYHRVVSTEDSAREGRFSVVVFFHPDHSIPYWDKEKFGRTQGMTPGFNYTIPFGEFSQYFTASLP